MTRRTKIFFFGTAAVFTAAAATLCLAVILNTADLPQSFLQVTADAGRRQFFDKNGEPLNASYLSYWNVQDVLPLYRIPEQLQKMFIAAEDGNFYAHSGVDWKARAAALFQNVRSGKVVRGASSLTEQVVRMIYPRPRTIFSKITEGIDAMRLERRFSKQAVLEFYLNQVPYASNRRGIAQAARYYFSKSPDRLSVREMAALAVLVRAPSSLDLYRYPDRIDKRVSAQLEKFKEQGVISKDEYLAASQERLHLSRPALNVSAEHFLNYVRTHALPPGSAVMTTLDGSLQEKIRRMTRGRLKDMKRRRVANAAVLVLDRHTGGVLAWVSESTNPDTAAYDSVLVPRQPASAQKPLLYALALSKGWTAATKIKDAPFSRAVGQGVHHFKNYSRTHYGDVTLRQALGNSLNIPALKTIEFVGINTYFAFLHQLGFSHFSKPADFYREGLALGNAEATLLELARAYLMLANNGILMPVRSFEMQENLEKPERVLPETAASLIGNILSDPMARRLEFGSDSVLNFPVQTAVKTGTSTDYRDAWAMGYNADFVAGVWMGNLTYDPMTEVTGSLGPALLLRSVFAELNRMKPAGPLYLSPRLERRKIGETTEYFDPDITESLPPETDDAVISTPENGIMLAIDPRVPIEYQEYKFSLNALPPKAVVSWFVDGKKLAESEVVSFFWRLERGSHTVRAEIILPDGEKIIPPEHTITVR